MLEGDNLQRIAQVIYGDASLWYSHAPTFEFQGALVDAFVYGLHEDSCEPRNNWREGYERLKKFFRKHTKKVRSNQGPKSSWAKPDIYFAVVNANRGCRPC